MSRVSENSHAASLELSLGKTKRKIEDLHLKGGNLKRIRKPSQDPVGNVEILTIKSRESINTQYKRNTEYALTNLRYVESSLGELTDLMVKAKEIALSQSSDLYNPGVRRSIAKEVEQIYNQLLSIANRRFGSRYLFSGHATNQSPFTREGNYLGDGGKIYIETARDFYVPINLTGKEVFTISKFRKAADSNKISEIDQLTLKQKSKEEENADVQKIDISRQKLDLEVKEFEKKSLSDPRLFDLVKSLETMLLASDTDSIQMLLEKYDDAIDHLITLRTRVGSLSNSVTSVADGLSKSEILDAERRSKIEDADLAKLFSDIQTQNNVLRASYKATASIFNQSLLDFLR